jgi:alpha-galactosidase
MSGRSAICRILLSGMLTYGFVHARTSVSSTSRETPDHSTRLLAAAPPLGWNSWDGYGTTVNEEQVKANAQWFAKHLKPYGWEYIVVDMEWFVTNPTPQGNSKLS